MKLPFISSIFGKKEKKEYFLALLLRDEKVTAVIFEELAGRVHVIAKEEELLDTSLEVMSLEQWLTVLDKIISQAETALPDNIETQKTIFGVNEGWVEESKIKKEYLLRLKKVSDELGLIPIGFLVIHEAIAHLLQEDEGVPISGILVELGQKHMTVSLLRAGRVIETKRTLLQENSPQATDQLLQHFTSYEVLPSRILVLSDKENGETLSQKFITHTWSKSLPFLHVPQITILPKNFDAKAVLSGAAVQMGFEFLTHTGEQPITQKSLQKEAPAISRLPKAEATIPTSTMDISLEPKEDPEVTDTLEQSADTDEEDFGFVKNADIKGKREKIPDEVEKEKEETIKIKTLEDVIEKSESLTMIESLPEETETPTKTNKKMFLLTLLPLYKKLLHTVKKLHLPLPSLPQSIVKKNKFIILLPIVAVFIAIGIGAYIFLMRAVVTLAITPQVAQEKATVTFSTKDTTDADKHIISAQPIDISEDGKISRPATGKKEIGDKAKGTVTIYNNTSDSKTFPAGTVLNGPNGLTFTLDADSPSIASASGDAISGTTPGKANVTVTASSIGKESNLPSGTVFSIKSFDKSGVAAKNDTAFSGGTKKDVMVVSKSDMTAAIEALTDSLTDKAKQELSQKADQNTSVLPLITNTTFSDKGSDKGVDDEATSFTLQGTVTYESLSYAKDDINGLVTKLLQKDKDQTHNQTDTSYDITDTKIANKTITGTLVAKTSLVPLFDNQKIVKDITGKSFADAKDILLKLPQASDVTIQLQPRIPFLPSLLPKFSNHISLVIKNQ